MSNSIIDRQREILAKLENPEGFNPDGSPVDDGSGAPPPTPAAGVPSQEPPQGGEPGAGSGTPPPNTPPAPGLAESEALKNANADLARQAAEFKQLYERQHGMVAPLQRKTAEQDRRIQELTHQVEDLMKGAPAAGAQVPPGQQAPPPAGTKDAALEEFLELYKDMVPGLESFIKTRLGAYVQPQLDQVKPAIDLAAKTTRQDLLAQHLAPLYVPHPNAGNIIRSEKFIQWVENQPAHSRSSIMEKINSPEHFPIAEIISIFDEFTKTNQPLPPPPPPQNLPSPGEMAVDVRRVPTSSTPGGTPIPQPLTRERMQEINRALTRDRDLYTPEQRDALKAELDSGVAVSNAAGYGLAPRLDTLTR